MIKQEIQSGINGQINQEFAAAFAYLGMAAYFEQERLAGFARWCQVQHEEEMRHAMRLFRYLLDRDGHVQIEAIDAPRTEYDSPLEAFRAAVSQEQENTQAIDTLYEQASALNDHATISHLQWFVNEQVEEEKMAGEALALIERAGSDASAILYLNDKLGLRQAERD